MRPNRNFSKLVERARRGEEIWIGKAGQPVAKLSAFDIPQRPRRPGLLKGKIKIRKDFDQAEVEGISLLTHDHRLKTYGPTIHFV